MPRKKRESNGVLPDRNQQGKKTPRHNGSQHYCVMCNNSGINERKYKSHSLQNLFGGVSDQAYVKEGLGGSLGNRVTAIKQYQKSEINVKGI